MLVFLDESGDPGMKLNRGSSRYFVVALVTFASNEEASACDEAITSLRARLSLPAGFEFHYTSNSQKQQRAFLETVNRFAFRTHILALNKARASRPGFHIDEPVHMLAARLTFEGAQPFLHQAIVVIDGSADRTFRRQFHSYLRSRINAPGEQHIARVKIQPAHQSNLLQLADYVASIAGSHLQAKKAGLYHSALLRAHEETFRSWP